MKRWTIIIGIIGLVAAVCFSDISSRINIRSNNGSVSNYPYQLKFQDGTVTDNGDGTMNISNGGTTTPIIASSATFGNATDTSYGNNGWVTINSSGTSEALIINVNGKPSGGYQNQLGALTIQSLTIGGPAATDEVITDSTTDPQNGTGLFEIWSNNPLHNDPKIWIHVAGHDSSPEIRDDAYAPNWEMINLSTDNAHGYGKYEPAAIANGGTVLQINSRSYDNSTFENLAFWNRLSAPAIDPNGAPGLYLQAQSLTNDSGNLAQADTSQLCFIGTNASNVCLTGPLAPVGGSYALGLPQIPKSAGQFVIFALNRGNNFSVRQTTWTDTDMTYSATTGLSVSSGTVSAKLTIPSMTIAQSQNRAPSAAGVETFYCSNCTNALTCVSTGTANGAYASQQAANRTTACN